MRKIYATAIWEYCDAKIAETLPSFERVSGKIAVEGWPIGRAYRMAAASDLYFYILLLFGKYNQFSFDLAWNRTNEIPARTKFDYFDRISDDPMFRSYMGGLYTNGDEWYDSEKQVEDLPKDENGKRDPVLSRHLIYEDQTPDEYLPKVHGGIDAAIPRLCYCALPFFEIVAERFGHKQDVPCLLPGYHFSKTIKDLFDRRMSQDLPEFQPSVGVQDAQLNSRIYRMTMNNPDFYRKGQLSYFIQFVVDETKGAIRVMLAWNDYRHSWSGKRVSDPYTIPSDGRGIVRLERFWIPDPTKGSWWRAKPAVETTPGNDDAAQAKEVEKAIDTAMRAIIKYALPYFRAIAECHNQPIPEFSRQTLMPLPNPVKIGE